MNCALCLYEDDGRSPAPAVTIANGHALCIGHFENSRELTTSSGGQPSLRNLARELADQL